MSLELVEAEKALEMKKKDPTTHLTPVEPDVEIDTTHRGKAIEYPEKNNFFEELDEDIRIVNKEYTATGGKDDIGGGYIYEGKLPINLVEPKPKVESTKPTEETEEVETEAEPTVDVVPEGEKSAPVEDDKENS